MEAKDWSFCLERLRALRDAFRTECRRKAPGIEGAREYAKDVGNALSRHLPWQGLPERDWALITAGGFGRGELSFSSDLDLLFLYRRRLTGQMENFLQELVSGLWDSGFKVGHVVSPFSGLDKLMRQDFSLRTNYLETGYLLGDRELHREWASRFVHCGGPRRTKRFVDNLVRYRQERLSRYGESTYLLEPHIKEGPGGLRDIHILRWAGVALFSRTGIQPLQDRGFLTRKESRWLEKARDFLWRVRLQLHDIRGRQQDHLLLEHQQDVASRLGYVPDPYQEKVFGVESFMRAFYQHTARVRRVTSFLLERFEQEYLRPGKQLGKRSTLSGPFVLEGQHIRFYDPQLIPSRPELLMELFWQAARTGAHFHHQTGQIVRENLGSFGQNQRVDPYVLELFFDILLDPEAAYPTLMMMLETGFLEQFIPELESIRYRMQYDVYHTYTVDEHLLRTVREMHLLLGPGWEELPGATDPENAQIWQSLKDKRTLFLAALLHDVGKGQGGGHARKGAERVEVISQRMGLAEGEREELVFLTREHLILAETALKRDLSDEKPIERCAVRIVSRHRLFMLYVMTVSDSRATGPQIWNSWRKALVQELFRKIDNLIRREGEGSGAEQARLEEVQDRARDALGEDGISEREAHSWLETLSVRYLLNREPEEVRRHFRLERELTRTGLPQLQSRLTSNGLWEITLACWDRPGLFVLLTGMLWANGINVLSADLYTRDYGVALDILVVDQIPDPLQPERILGTLRRDLEQVLTGQVTLESMLHWKQPRAPVGQRTKIVPRKDRVHIDEEASDFYTVIEVYTWDRPGLLYTISHVLFRFSLTIQMAKIATPGAQVVDVFYVTDETGEKIGDPEVHSSLREAMLQALSQKE